MSNDIFPSVFSENEAPIVVDSRPTIGEMANEYADQTAHAKYSQTKSDQTIRRQRADLKLFFQFLEQSHYEYPISNFPASSDWQLWANVTYGLVEAFLLWQLKQGYSIGSINVRLATVKVYAELAHKAKAIPLHEKNAILLVKGYSHKDGVHIDKKRQQTRREEAKKAAPTSFNSGHARQLKDQPIKRDAAMMCLLLDHGLRVGELVSLQVQHINLKEGTLTFYREKVDLEQTHKLSEETNAALNSYMPTIEGPYLFPGYKGRPMSTRRVNKLVAYLGLAVGIEGLSPHDCRHYWATAAVKNGTDIKSLQEAGGWKSPAMPLRYVERAKIANEGVKLG